MKTVTDDENLPKLSFFETCSWWLYNRKPKFFNVSIKHTGAHHPPMFHLNTSVHGDFTIENPSFSMYLLSTQVHTIPLCFKILKILFGLELSWFWIEGNGCFLDFWLFTYHCVVKSSMCTVSNYLNELQNSGESMGDSDLHVDFGPVT